MSDSISNSEFQMTIEPQVDTSERGRLLATISLAFAIAGGVLSVVQTVLTFNLADSGLIGAFAAIIVIAAIVVGNVAIHQTERGMPGHARAVAATVIGYVSAGLLVIVPILVVIGVIVVVVTVIAGLFALFGETYGQLGR